jgi:hypothetical protein
METAGAASATDPVSVLDAGTFLVVDAHTTPLGEVLDRLKNHLAATVAHADRLDLSRLIDGHKSGTLTEILQWLAPNAGFIIIYSDKNGGVRRVEQIGFLPTGPAEQTTSDARKQSSSAGGPAEAKNSVGDEAVSIRSPTTARVMSSFDTPESKGKPDLPYTKKDEVKGVAQQLHSVLPETQLATERQANSPAPTATPDFLSSPNNVAQLSIQQQIERSQALATEQLRALIDAYKAVGRH